MIAFEQYVHVDRIHRPVDAIEIRRVQLEYFQQLLHEIVRARVINFQPHRIAAPPVAQFVLHRLQQIFRIFLFHVQFAVACYAEAPVAQDLCAGKQILDEIGNDIRKKLLYSDSSSQDPVVKTLVKKISKGEYDAEDLGLRYPVETFLQELDNALFDNTLKEFLN